MRYYKHLLIIIFFTCLLFCNKTNAEFHLDQYGEALIMEDLAEIHASEFPKILREVFNSYDKLDPNKPDDKQKLDLVAEYLPYFKEKFIVTYIRKFEDRAFCSTIPSYHIAATISRKELYSWHITLYQDKQGKYNICDMMHDEWLWSRRQRFFSDAKKSKKYWIN